MKFGGASVASPDKFSSCAELVAARREEYPRIVIVVSAMRGMTEQLISLAQEVHPAPPRREYDMLVSVGERISISLLAMALAAQGHEAVSFTGSQSGIMTSSHHGEAKILEVRPKRILEALGRRQIAIVAGFQGVSLEREITTLGRGGSDTTAVALGVALRAEKVEFFKDVGGIYTANPKVALDAELISELSHGQALEVVNKTGGQVLHPRALELAARSGLPLHLRPFPPRSGSGTTITSSSTPLSCPLYEK